MTAVDVGDAIELTFTSAPGASVMVTWLDPSGTVIDDVSVTESPAGSGRFPKTFLPNSPGVWEALFVASGAATAVERYYVRASPITGPPPLATVGEVGAQFGSMTPAQEGLTSWLVRAASKLVRSRVPYIDTWITAGTIDPEVVSLVVVNMVLRVLRNPNGLRSETIGPFSRAYDTSVAAGMLGLATEELAILVPVPAAATRSRVGTIMLRPGLAPPPYGITRPRW